MAKCLADLFTWFSSCNSDPQSSRLNWQVSLRLRLRQTLPPLLPLTNTDLHSSTQNHRPPELGKLGQVVFQVDFAVIAGLMFSQQILKEVHQLIIVGLLFSSVPIYYGLVFGEIYSRLGNVLQLIGITLTLCLVCGLVGTFLHSGLSYACWVCAILYLLPLLYSLYYRCF